MKKLLSIVLAFAIAMTMTGCLSGVYHATGEFEHPYEATSDCWQYCLGVWWRTPNTEVENAMDAYTKLVYPFWIVDFPLEVVFDTVAFPADEIIYLCQDKEKK